MYFVITFDILCWPLSIHENWKRNDVDLSPSQWGSILLVWVFWAPQPHNRCEPKSTHTYVSPKWANLDLDWIPSLFNTSCHYGPDECVFCDDSTIQNISNFFWLRCFLSFSCGIWFKIPQRDVSAISFMCALKICITCDVCDNIERRRLEFGTPYSWQTPSRVCPFIY